MAYDDRRTPEQHACDRILYSSAFRRLAGVTQVVAVHETQLLHNRLTHSLKVAQLGRRLAQTLARDDELEDLPPEAKPDPDVAEASGLAHDLGHPPFGHIGEERLHQKCEKAGLDGFNGNAQSFRILTKLARRNSEKPGLELPPRTLNAILKYPWMREDDHSSDRKWGAYTSEKAQFEEARQGVSNEHKSVEAALMDWADDVSYATHDLEDFYRAGLIPLDSMWREQLDRGVVLTEEGQSFLAKAAAALSGRDGFDGELGALALKELGTLVDQDLPYRGDRSHRRALHRQTSFLITRYLGAFQVHAGPPFCTITREMRHEVMMLKQMTWQYVINSPQLAAVQRGQMLIVDELFEHLCSWLEDEFKQASRHRLPNRLRDYYLDAVDDGSGVAAIRDRLGAEVTDEMTKTALQARAVSDYICSLTEAQAVDLHERVTGFSRRSMLEGWVRA